MSSPAEFTLVAGRWLWPFVIVLDVVRRLGWQPTSSGEQARTALHR